MTTYIKPGVKHDFFLKINISIYLKKLIINKLHVPQITMTTYSAMDSDITLYITYLHHLLLTYVRKTSKIIN